MRAQRGFVCAALVAALFAAAGFTAPRASAVVLPPANDDFANAAPLSFGPNGSGVVDMSAATTEAGEPNTANFAGGSAWWGFATPSPERIHLSWSGCAWFDVYRIDAPGFAGLTDVVQNRNEAGPTESYTFTTDPAASYAVQCGSYTGVVNATIFGQVATIPANDDYANAAAVTLGVPLDVDMTGASAEAVEPGISYPDLKTAWFTWTATQDGLVLANNGNAYTVTGPGFAGLIADTPFPGQPIAVTAGTTYAFQLVVPNGFPTYFGENPIVTFELDAVVPPANDDLANAVPLTPGDTVSADITGATLEPGEPVLPTQLDINGHPMSKSLWWTFSVPASELVTFHCFNCDALMGYTMNGPGFAGLSQVAGLPPAPLVSGLDLSIDAVPGTTYAVQLGGVDYRVGVEQMASSVHLPPANDALSDARALPADPTQINFPDGVFINAATTEAGEPNVDAASQTFGPYGIPMTKSVWWTWTPAVDTDVTILGQPVMFVYTSTGPGFAGLSQVPKPNPYGVTVLHAVADTTYYLQIVGSYTDSAFVTPRIDTMAPDPANDDYANAAPLPFFHQPTSIGALDSATVEADEPNLTPWWGGTPFSKSLWWTWTAPADVRIAGNLSCGATNVYRVDGPGFDGLTLLQQAPNVTLDATSGEEFAFQCLASYGQNFTATDQFDLLANHASASSGGAAPGTVTITSPDGTYVVNVGVSAVSSGALPPDVVDLSGALSYGITNVTPGSSVQVTIQLPAGSNPNAAYKLSNGSYVDDADLATFSGDSVTLTLTDGGAGDSDGRADGNISDPVVLTRAATTPNAPTNVAVVRANASGRVSFQAPASNGGSTITSYTVACTSINGGVGRTATGTASPITVSGLTNGRTYSCRVTARNAVGPGTASAASASFVPATTPGAPKISAVATKSATSTSGGISVAFTAPPNTGGSTITSYTATCSSSNGGTTRAATAPTSPITVIGLSTGRSYRCSVRAGNAVGQGPASALSTSVIVGAPGTASNVHTTHVASGQLRVTFIAAPANGATITSYAATCTSTNGGVTKSKTGFTSPLTVTGLTAGKTYTCFVTAANSRGTGPASIASAAVIA
jgi:hypothetical protein